MPIITRSTGEPSGRINYLITITSTRHTTSSQSSCCRHLEADHEGEGEGDEEEAPGDPEQDAAAEPHAAVVTILVCVEARRY